MNNRPEYPVLGVTPPKSMGESHSIPVTQEPENPFAIKTHTVPPVIGADRLPEAPEKPAPVYHEGVFSGRTQKLGGVAVGTPELETERPGPKHRPDELSKEEITEVKESRGGSDPYLPYGEHNRR